MIETTRRLLNLLDALCNHKDHLTKNVAEYVDATIARYIIFRVEAWMVLRAELSAFTWNLFSPKTLVI